MIAVGCSIAVPSPKHSFHHRGVQTVVVALIFQQEVAQAQPLPNRRTGEGRRSWQFATILYTNKYISITQTLHTCVCLYTKQHMFDFLFKKERIIEKVSISQSWEYLKHAQWEVSHKSHRSNLLCKILQCGKTNYNTSTHFSSGTRWNPRTRMLTRMIANPGIIVMREEKGSVNCGV